MKQRAHERYEDVMQKGKINNLWYCSDEAAIRSIPKLLVPGSILSSFAT